jgi:hypothetical protein
MIAAVCKSAGHSRRYTYSLSIHEHNDDVKYIDYCYNYKVAITKLIKTDSSTCITTDRSTFVSRVRIYQASDSNNVITHSNR